MFRKIRFSDYFHLLNLGLNTKQSQTMTETTISNLRMLIECEEQGKAAMNEYMAATKHEFGSIFSKHSAETDNIIKMFTEQRSEFAKQLDILNNQLGQTFSQFNRDMIRMSELISENSSTMTSMCDSITKTMEANSDVTIEHLRTNRQQLTEKHESNNQISTTMENLVDQLKNLIAQSRDNNGKLKTVTSSLESSETRIKQELNVNISNIMNFKDQMSTEISSMNEKLKECDQSVKSISADTTEIVAATKVNEQRSADCMANIQSAFNSQTTSLTERIDEMIEKVVDQCEKTKIDVGGGLEAIIHNVSVEQDRINSHNDEFSDVMQNLEQTQTEYQQMLSTDLDVCAQRLNKFHSNDLKIYKSTGETPSKRDYVFPKVLAATSPHAKIIKEFWENHDVDDLNCSAINTIPEVMMREKFVTSNDFQ